MFINLSKEQYLEDRYTLKESLKTEVERDLLETNW